MSRQQHYFNRRMVFDHLPKTAGQAINAWLRTELGTGCVTENLNGQHDELLNRYGGRYPIISGHLHFENSDLDPRYEYFTLLREPEERAISWIFYLLNNVPYECSTASLIDGARSFVNGCEPTSEFLLSMTNPYVNHFCQIGLRPKKLACNDVGYAIAQIRRFTLYGFYSEMDHFLEEVSVLMGIPNPQAIPKVNTTVTKPKPDSVDASLRGRILELIDKDIEFYNCLLGEYKQMTRKAVQGVEQSLWLKYEKADKSLEFWSSNEVRLEEISVKSNTTLYSGEIAVFSLQFALDRHINDLEVVARIIDEYGNLAFESRNNDLSETLIQVAPGVYTITHSIVVDLPKGVYSVGCSLVEKMPDGLSNELLRHNALFNMNIVMPERRMGNGYADLPYTQALTQSALFEKNLIEDASGRMTLLSALDVAALSVGQRIKVCVSVRNQTDIPWIGDPFRPINLSYHWFDASGAVVIADGERTVLNEGWVGAQGEAVCEMVVVMPEVAGVYRLMLTLVQEGVAWFETMGFEAALIEQINIQ